MNVTQPDINMAAETGNANTFGTVTRIEILRANHTFRL